MPELNDQQFGATSDRLARYLSTEFGPQAVSADYEALDRGETPSQVFRSVSEEEWELAQKQGFLQSDQRWDKEHYAPEEFPGRGTYAAAEAAPGYIRETGGRVLGIQTDPQDEWQSLLEEEAPEFATRKPIPIERVKPSRHIDPGGKLPPAIPGLKRDPVQVSKRSVYWTPDK